MTPKEQKKLKAIKALLKKRIALFDASARGLRLKGRIGSALHDSGCANGLSLARNMLEDL